MVTVTTVTDSVSITNGMGIIVGLIDVSNGVLDGKAIESGTLLLSRLIPVKHQKTPVPALNKIGGVSGVNAYWETRDTKKFGVGFSP